MRSLPLHTACVPRLLPFSRSFLNSVARSVRPRPHKYSTVCGRMFPRWKKPTITCGSIMLCDAQPSKYSACDYLQSDASELKKHTDEWWQHRQSTNSGGINVLQCSWRWLRPSVSADTSCAETETEDEPEHDTDGNSSTWTVSPSRTSQTVAQVTPLPAKAINL